ncbi:hypothetical protein ACQEU3_06065 [Spirillospora sp. CA-253888]
MKALTSPTPDEGWDLPEIPPPSARRSWSVRGRLWTLTLLAVLLAVSASGGLVLGAERLRTAAQRAQQAAAQAFAATDLYGSLGALDSRLAELSLVGREPIGGGPDAALRDFEAARGRAVADLGRLTAAARTSEDRRESRAIADGLSRYTALAGQAVALDRQAAHPAGRPPAPVLERQREATDLMHRTLLPTVQRMIKTAAARVDRAHAEGDAGADAALRTAILAGTALVMVLVALQILLARRHRRLLNPALAVACVVAAALPLVGAAQPTAERSRLRDVRTGAFVPALELAEVRAIGRDAFGDQSRAIIDPAREAHYRQELMAKNRQVAWARVGQGEDVTSALHRALDENTGGGPPDFGGRLGAALNVPARPGGQALADDVLAKLRVHLDRAAAVRALPEKDLPSRAELLVADASWGEGYAFERYDVALTDLLAFHDRHYQASVAATEDHLRGRTGGPLWAGAAVLALLLVGLRPRLAEYRR